MKATNLLHWVLCAV
jgi:hypothetical protein